MLSDQQILPQKPQWALAILRGGSLRSRRTHQIQASSPDLSVSKLAVASRAVISKFCLCLSNFLTSQFLVPFKKTKAKIKTKIKRCYRSKLELQLDKYSTI